MNRTALALAAALATGAACSSKTENPRPPPLAVTAAPGAVRANGTATVAVHVEGSSSPPLRVSTSKGTFPGGLKSVVVDATVADLVLTACDVQADSTCTGAMTISAVDNAFAIGQATVTLIGPETVCNDGLDNNGDNNVDCADPDCNLQACRTTGGQAGTCGAGVCTAAVCTPNPPEVCSDGVDNDCNGSADCADSACDGQACSASSPSSVCSAGACSDLAAGLALNVTAARSRLPADGLAETDITVTLQSGGNPLGGATIALTTDLGSFASSGTQAANATTDAQGLALVRFRASATPGTATIRAAPAAVPTLSVQVQVVMPALGSIEPVAPQYRVMGVRYSGFQEQNALAVKLLDTEQKAYPDGLQVRFEHQQLGGSEISKPWVPCSVPSTSCLAFLGATASPAGEPDSEGLAPVNLYSGTAAGPLAIGVTATAGGITRTFTIQNIAVVGARASGSHVSVLCSPLNVPALIYDDCTNSFYSGDDALITCQAFLADRFNNVLGVATQVEFRSEAGSAGPPVLTAAYDPEAGGDQTAELGRAVNSVRVTGGPLPVDVDPLVGEFASTFDSGCGPTAHNPRDGLSTVMVAARGEEGFVDVNGNGVYDLGEPFIDQGEPFVDVDDNGVRTDGLTGPYEPFIDVNQNGVWDGPNGAWDADAVVWAEARVLYTGLPAVSSDGFGNQLFSRWYSAGSPPAATTTAVFSVNSSTPGPATAQAFSLFFTDQNFNPITPKASYAVASLFGVADAELITAPNTVDNLGLLFTQQFCAAAPPAPPGACSATCQSAPCYRVARVLGFAYGTYASAQIKGGADPGLDVAQATCTVESIVVPVSIAGTVN